MESYRPQFHFSSARSWLNDPNGLVHHDGVYHLFFQCNPAGDTWGNMSWGHAVSPDLMRWEELPLAISHNEREQIYSGSAVVDVENTSGLGTDAGPAMVAIYTSQSKAVARQAQALASSLDDGLTWTKHPGNPVLDIGSADFRDPKVQWCAGTGTWLMSVCNSLEQTVSFYSSSDLMTWSLLSVFSPADAVGEVWECPDLFPLPVDGDGVEVWVLVVSVVPGAIAGGSGTQYFLGDFDGERFVPHDDRVRWLDHGKDYYAAVSWEGDPAGRHMIGWMNNWHYAAATPTESWRGAMSTPRRMSLLTIDSHPRLVQHPVDSLAGLRSTTASRRMVRLDDERSPGDLPRGTSYDIAAVIDVGDADRVGFAVRVGDGEETRVGFDVSQGSIYVDRTASGDHSFSPDFAGIHRAPLDLRDGRLVLRILVDRSSVEVFGGQGEAVITDLVFPALASDGLAMFAEGGTATFEDVTVSQLTTHRS